MKIAVLKWAYKQEPKLGFCPVPDCGKIKNLPDSAVEAAESVLHAAHVGMASLIGELEKRVPAGTVVGPCRCEGRVGTAGSEP